MNEILNTEHRGDLLRGRDLLRAGFSRRTFGRFASLLAAGASLPFYNESAMAQLSAIRGPMPADAVKINANENPLGPCPEAWRQSRRSRVMAADTFTRKRSGFRNYWQQEGLKPDYVQPYAGSSAPLHQAVLAFCSPVRPFVTSDPGYEAG